MSLNYRRQIQCYRENRLFQSFISQMENSYDYGDNKRILNILKDTDLEEIDERLTYKQRKWLSMLDEVVLDTIQFLSQKIADFKNASNQGITIYGLLALVDSKLIQIMKLRMLIKPEIVATSTTQSITKHKYVILRAFWLDNNFKKIRKFSVSLGNEEQIGDYRKVNPKDFKEHYEELWHKIENFYFSEYS